MRLWIISVIKQDKRPSVRINNPDVLLNIHIAQTTCTLSLDSSGESLHRRGYRQEAVEAPLNEVLAAGMILMTGWRGECDLIDPMCGSGTIPIEAALIAKNIAPGVFRKGFAFEKWVDFDADMFDEIYNDDSQEREFTHKIYGYDNNPKANEIATHNIKAAGVSKDVVLKLQPFQQFEQPKEKSIIITNPPYGERISTNDLLGLYQMIGERLKHAFVGNEAWVLSYREECFDQIGLKQVRKFLCSMDRWSVNSANMRFLTENTKSSRARKRAKRRKRLKENRLQDSEKEKSLSHAAKVSSNRVGMVNPDLAERENTSRAEKVMTSKAATEIESHGENSAEEEIQEGQENLGEPGAEDSEEGRGIG